MPGCQPGLPPSGGGRPHGAACRTPPPAEARIRRGGPTERGSVSRTEPRRAGPPGAAGARAVTGVPSCASASRLAHHRDPGPGPNDRIRPGRGMRGARAAAAGAREPAPRAARVPPAFPRQRGARPGSPCRSRREPGVRFPKGGGASRAGRGPEREQRRRIPGPPTGTAEPRAWGVPSP